MRVRALVAAQCLVLALASTLAAAPRAAPGVPFAVVVYKDFSQTVDNGKTDLDPVAWRFDDGNAKLKLSGSAADLLELEVAGGLRGTAFALAFAAPRGRRLVEGGVYTEAGAPAKRTPAAAGLNVSRPKPACDVRDGSFEIKRLARSGGRVTRAWIVFFVRCAGMQFFGEVRVGDPAPLGERVEPTLVRWPDTDLGATRDPGVTTTTPVPVTIVPSRGDLRVSRAVLSGRNRRDFAIRKDECAGRTLADGASCQVWVQFLPRAAGTRTALLSVAAGGARASAALQGFAHGGRTGAELRSSPGDFVGAGGEWHLTPTTAKFFLDDGIDPNDRRGAHLGIQMPASEFTIEFVPNYPGRLTPHTTYPDARRWPFNDAAPGLAVEHDGHACNEVRGTFTVDTVTFSRRGVVRSFATTFEQYCDDDQEPLRGTVWYRAGDRTRPAPWMVDSGR